MIAAGIGSPETPSEGPSVVGVSATAESTPGVARTASRVDGGSPGPELESARSAESPAWRCAVIAWSRVVVLNSSVQLMATVSTSGVLAEENRRLAAPRFADARNPPTGEMAPNNGRNSLAANIATSGPRQPAAITRKIASSSEVAAAVAGVVVAAETANSGIAAAIAIRPPIKRPGPTLRVSTEASVRARVGAVRAARRLADKTASNAT